MKMFQPSRLWRWIGTGLAAAAIYRWAVRPWSRTWGATPDEAARRLPGDALVPEPDYVTTRALTIQAPADAVWPWLVQMGQGRGGFYSYDVLENLLGLGIHSADRIVPAWQRVQVGDPVRMAPPDRFGGTARMEVARLDPGRAFVLAAPSDLPGNTGTPAAWAFVLAPTGRATTRLVVRTRMTGAPAFLLLLKPAHFIMEQKMMRGIRARAERTANRVSSTPPPVR